MVINNWNNIIFLYLVFEFFPVCFAQENQFEATEETSFRIKDELTQAKLDQIVDGLKVKALKRFFPTRIQNSLITQETQNNSEFSINSKGKTLSTISGIWVKDITPPEITYFKKGKDTWISVKVHGYVAKKPSKTEARELLLKQLSARPLLEGVQVHSIEYYPSDFITSVVVLDKRIHTNEANINTEARMIAESNLQEAAIIGNYRKAYGWVPSVEFLTTLKGATDHHIVYIFIKEVEEE